MTEAEIVANADVASQDDEEQDLVDPTPSASKKKKKRLKKKKRITDGLGTATSKDKATDKDTEGQQPDSPFPNSSETMKGEKVEKEGSKVKKENIKEAKDHPHTSDSDDVPCLFNDLGVAPWLCRTLDELKMTVPTDIQKLAIPLIMEGKNVCGNARTGSGKTAAFALPIIQHLSKDPYGIFALVITPTRELALQISHAFTSFGQSFRIRQAVLIGGMNGVGQQKTMLKRPHVVTSTPGRLLDFLEGYSGPEPFKKLKYFVLDEADRLLAEAFLPDIERVLVHLPTNRQSLLFSATLTKELKDPSSAVLRKISDQPVVLADANKGDETLYSTAKNLQERYVWIPEMLKLSYLHHLLSSDVLQANSVMVFCSSCKETEFVRLTLQILGLPVLSISGYQMQIRRFQNLGRFKAGMARILVATDVASRGLDIPTVDVVVNYEPPTEAKEYVHRVGRTARAGRGGLAITFVTPPDVAKVQEIEHVIGHQLMEYEVDEEAATADLDTVTRAQLEAWRSYKTSFEANETRIKKIKSAKSEEVDKDRSIDVEQPSMKRVKLLKRTK